MSQPYVLFGDAQLTDYCVVSDIRESLAPMTIRTTDVPGRDGAMFLGAALAPKDVKMTLTLRKGHPYNDINMARQIIADILSRRNEGRLVIETDGGRYRNAVCTAAGEIKRYRNGVSFDVTFRVSDPVYYGTSRTVIVPSGGSLNFATTGTYPTLPTISVPSASNGSGGFWRLTDERGNYVQATIPSGVATAPVGIDCANRVMRVNNQVQVLPLGADWLVLNPGSNHTLTMTGTGAAYVTYTERWV